MPEDACDGICIFLEMLKNLWILFSVTFLFQELVTWFSLKYPTFHASKYFKSPILRIRKEKWDNSKFSNIEKWGISRKNHVINYKTGKEPKMIVFDFGAFQRKMQMLSQDKILLHMLFGAL